MDIWTFSWIAWIVYFAIVEGIALANSVSGDTLSEHIWVWFGTQRTVLKPGETPKERSGWTQFRRFMLLAGMGWLAVHFLTGGWV